MSSIRYALDGRYELAVTLIGAAVVLDGLDGRSARMLNLTSRLGAELDSLADFLSFGVAPGGPDLSLDPARRARRRLGGGDAVRDLLRAAPRPLQHRAGTPDRPRWTQYFFTGIPAPAAAGLALTPMIMSFVVGGGWPRSWLLNAAFLVFVAGMMVSRVPTYSIKRIRIAPDQVLPTLLLASVIIVGLVVEPWLTLSLIGIVYLCSLPFAFLSARRMRKGEAASRTEGRRQTPQPRASGWSAWASAPSARLDRVVIAATGQATDAGRAAATGDRSAAGPGGGGSGAAWDRRRHAHPWRLRPGFAGDGRGDGRALRCRLGAARGQPAGRRTRRCRRPAFAADRSRRLPRHRPRLHRLRRHGVRASRSPIPAPTPWRRPSCCSPSWGPARHFSPSP